MNPYYQLQRTALHLLLFLCCVTTVTAQKPAVPAITDPLSDYMSMFLSDWLQPKPTPPKDRPNWRMSGGDDNFIPVGGILERFTLPGRKGHELPKLLFIRNWADWSLDFSELSHLDEMWFVYLCDENGQWHRQFSHSYNYFQAKLEGINDEVDYYIYLKLYGGRFTPKSYPFSFQSGKIEDGKETPYPDEWPKGFRPFKHPHSEWITVGDYVSQPNPRWHQDELPQDKEHLAELIKHTKVFSLDYLQKWFAKAAGNPPAKPKK